MPRKTILCRKIRLKFQRIEILAFSDHSGIELEVNINQIPNKWKLNHAVCTVPTGPLGRPHSGVQKDTLYSGLGMVSPPQWEGKAMTLYKSSLHTWLCVKTCFRRSNSCHPHTAIPVGGLRLKWLAQSFVASGWDSWGRGWVSLTPEALLWTTLVWSLNHVCIVAFPFLMRFLELWSCLMKMCPLSTLIVYSCTFSISCNYCFY